MAETAPDQGSSAFPLPAGGLRPTMYLGPESAVPPEYADVPIRELFALIEAERQDHAIAAERESLAAGFLPRPPSASGRSGSGFESGGVLDTSAPDAVLAGLADAATRDGHLAELDDDELIGAMRAWKRLGSWCSSNLLATVAELARRRPAEPTNRHSAERAAAALVPRPYPATSPAVAASSAPAGSPASAGPPTPAAPFAPAATLTPTGTPGSAGSPVPAAFPAQISEFVSDEVAAALTLTDRAASSCVDVSVDLATRLPLTARAHHAGLIDFDRVRLIAEATRVLSDDDARQVEARIWPRAADQTTGRLRAALARAVIAVDPEAAARRREEAQKDPRVRRWQEDAGTAALAGYGLPPADVLAADQLLTARARALRDAGLPGSLEELRARAYLDALLDRDSIPAAAPPPPLDPAQSPAPAPRPGPRLPALINLTLPLTTRLGLADEPGVVGGFGPVDAELARKLAALAATDPRSRCCVTLTGPGGRAVGHGCLPGPSALANLTTGGLSLTITPLAQDTCDHRHQEPGYEPSRRLQHLIWARTPTCTAPGCRRPAARCDLDHNVPYDEGGRTCECNLAPLCRHHHRCKHSPGWQLGQLSPGGMRWITPAGREYITRPDAYP